MGLIVAEPRCAFCALFDVRIRHEILNTEAQKRFLNFVQLVWLLGDTFLDEKFKGLAEADASDLIQPTRLSSECLVVDLDE